MKLRSTPVIALLMCCALAVTSVNSAMGFSKENLNSQISSLILTCRDAALAKNFAYPEAKERFRESFLLDPLVVAATPTAPTCYGGINGSIALTVTGGTSPYTYL